MKTFICILALAVVAVNAGLVHHAPLGGLAYSGGLSGGLGSGLVYGSGLSHGVALGGGHGLALGGHGLALGGLSYGLGGGHQVVKVLHQEQAPLLLAAPVQHSTQVVKVIHQHAPAPAPVLVHHTPIVHHAPVVHHAPAAVKIVKVLHEAPTGW